MPRSPRAQSLLLAALAVLVLVSGAAFASTFGAQFTWQQRDTVATSVDGYAVGDGTPAVRVRLTVENPLDRSIEVANAELVVYEGEAPFDDGEQLTVPRSSSVSDTTVPAGGERTVTVTARVAADAADRVRAAVANGSATASGVVEVRLAGREFSVDV